MRHICMKLLRIPLLLTGLATLVILFGSTGAALAAGTGNTVSINGALNDPLGLTIAPNGNILTVNGNDGFIVETTPGGKQVASQPIDNTPVTGEPNGFGCLFGLALIGRDDGVYFVDDCTNTLNTLK
jgi:hypothetical protein